jgi:hypothetical protein
MSFGGEIIALTKASEGLAGVAGGGVYYFNAPDNISSTSNFVVISWKKTDSIDTPGGVGFLRTYELTVLCFSPDTSDLEDIVDQIYSTLLGQTSNNIADIVFVSESSTIDSEKQRYMKSIVFNAFYV